MQPESMRTAFVGLGVMGYPMAGFLAKGGHATAVYNRTASKAEKWVAEFGGSSANTPRKAATGADMVFCCVGNDDDVRDVILGEDGALNGVERGAIIVDTRRLRQASRERFMPQRQQRAWVFSTHPYLVARRVPRMVS